MLKFICPNCKHTQLECVQTDCTIITPIKVDENNEELEYDLYKQEITDSLISCFQCQNCGWRVTEAGENLQYENELIQWLGEQPYNNN